MPSILFHELIGYKIAKKYRKYDTNNFYLGLMVPDSVNAYGFASKEDRWRTHRRDENLKKWKENIINYYNENIDKYEKTYLMGYLIHVLTDIICDEIYQNELYSKLIDKGFDYNSAYKHYEKGIEKFENSNINEKWWKEAKDKFKNAEVLPINGMSRKMILDEVKYTLQKYDERTYEREEFISEKFADEVAGKVEEVIKVLVNEFSDSDKIINL